MARYATRIDQVQGHEHCTDYNAYREHLGRVHCQHERHADHGGAKAGNDLAAHRTANKLNNPDGQDQRCNTIELGSAIRQRGDQHEKTAKYCADETEANALGCGGSVCGRSRHVCYRRW